MLIRACLRERMGLLGLGCAYQNVNCAGWVAAIVKRNESKKKKMDFGNILLDAPNHSISHSYPISCIEHRIILLSITFPSRTPFPIHHPSLSLFTTPYNDSPPPTHTKYLEQTNQYTPIKKQVKPPNLHIIQQMVKERLRHPSNRLIPMPIYPPTHPPSLRFRIKHCSTIRTRYGLHTINFSSTRSESKI